MANYPFINLASHTDPEPWDWFPQLWSFSEPTAWQGFLQCPPECFSCHDSGELWGFHRVHACGLQQPRGCQQAAQTQSPGQGLWECPGQEMPPPQPLPPRGEEQWCHPAATWHLRGTGGDARAQSYWGSCSLVVELQQHLEAARAFPMSLAVNKPLPCREVPTQYPKGLRNRTLSNLLSLRCF